MICFKSDKAYNAGGIACTCCKGAGKSKLFPCPSAASVSIIADDGYFGTFKTVKNANAFTELLSEPNSKKADETQMMDKAERNSKFDNCRGILILLVVFGHILELNLGYGNNRFWYLVIYSFHMPFFAYLTGYFSKFDWKKLLKKLLLPYLVFQTLYLLFSQFILQDKLPMQYTTPYWLLWYLIAAAVWHAALRLLNRAACGRKTAVVTGMLLTGAAFLAGFINEIGREFSLSRIIVFFPFCFWGYVSHIRAPLGIRSSSLKKAASAAGVLLLTIVIAVYAGQMKISWFYEAASYRATAMPPSVRLWHMGIAAVWVLFFLQWVPGEKLALITGLGKNTMPVYLMHGFVIKWIGMKGFFADDFYLPAAILLTLVLTAILTFSYFFVSSRCRLLRKSKH